MERNPPCLLLLKTKCNFKNLVEEEEVVTGSIISAGQENGQARKEQLKKNFEFIPKSTYQLSATCQKITPSV